MALMGCPRCKNRNVPKRAVHTHDCIGCIDMLVKINVCIVRVKISELISISAIHFSFPIR